MDREAPRLVECFSFGRLINPWVKLVLTVRLFRLQRQGTSGSAHRELRVKEICLLLKWLFNNLRLPSDLGHNFILGVPCPLLFSVTTLQDGLKIPFWLGRKEPFVLLFILLCHLIVIVTRRHRWGFRLFSFARNSRALELVGQ